MGYPLTHLLRFRKIGTRFAGDQVRIGTRMYVTFRAVIIPTLDCVFKDICVPFDQAWCHQATHNVHKYGEA